MSPADDADSDLDPGTPHPGTLHHGTSSWSESSWVGAFYPPGTAAGDFLTHYATQFRTVEADTTYYRVPSERMVDGWNAKTPDHFRLAAKFPRSIVHAGTGAAPDADRLLLPEHCGEDAARFLEVMARLGPKCGPLVLQFPYFNRKTFASASPFLERLDNFLAELPERFRYAVEIRNKGWVKQPLLDILRRHRVAMVWVDLLYMPHPADLAEQFGGVAPLCTTDFVYARLIGDRKKVDDAGGGRFDQIVVDQSSRLDRWGKLLSELLDSGHDAWVYANNHYAGHGPATIRDLARRVSGNLL